MGVDSRNHNRIKLQRSKGKRFFNRFDKINSSEDGDELLSVLEQGGNIIGEHDSDQKIKEKNEISETVITIKHRLQNARSTLKSTSWTISKAPPKLRRLHQHSFNPAHVAIGPLHHPSKKDHLSSMEEHKLRFLDLLLDKMSLPPVHEHDDEEQNDTSVKLAVEELESHQPSDQTAGGSSSSSSSSSTNANDKKIEYLVVAMKELEAYTRACYTETSDISSSEYVKMMIIDGCFVVELLRIYAKCGVCGPDTVNEPIFNTRWIVPTLQQELLMLENQLPFPVLEKIFDITSDTRPEEDRSTLKDLTLTFFNSLLCREMEKVDSGMCEVDNNDPVHLLELFRSSFPVPKKDLSIGKNPSRLRSWVRISPRGIHAAIRNIKTCLRLRQDPSPYWIHEGKLLMHCASELKKAGISFEKREKHDLLDIDFKNGKLYIPPLLINDSTALMFLNFVAYEQCFPLTEPYFTTYLSFWDSLLNSAKDVKCLRSKGIIDHVLGSDEDVAQLFNKLCKEVAQDFRYCYLSKVIEDVNDYFGGRRHIWRAKAKQDYFNSPWAILSLIAAIFLLILTFIQTFFAVFPRKQ